MTHEHAISTYVSESHRRSNAIKAKHSKSNVCLCGAVYALERWHVIEDPEERARSLRWALSREAEKRSSAVPGIRHEEAADA